MKTDAEKLIILLIRGYAKKAKSKTMYGHQRCWENHGQNQLRLYGKTNVKMLFSTVRTEQN